MSLALGQAWPWEGHNQGCGRTSGWDAGRRESIVGPEAEYQAPHGQLGLSCTCCSWTACPGVTYELFWDITSLLGDTGRLHPLSASLASCLPPGPHWLLKYSRHMPASEPRHRLLSTGSFLPKDTPTAHSLKSHLFRGASLTTLFKGTIPSLAQHSTSPLHLPIHCSKLLMDLVSYLSLNCQFHKGKNLSFVPSYVPLPAPCSLKHRWCTAHVLFNERKHRKVQGRVEYNCTARMWGWLS